MNQVLVINLDGPDFRDYQALEIVKMWDEASKILYFKNLNSNKSMDVKKIFS